MVIAMRASRQELAESADALLASGARALDVHGDLNTAHKLFEAAYSAGESDGDLRVMAEAALGTGGWWTGERRTAVAAELLRARLRHALPLLDPDCPLAIRVRVRLAAEDSYRAGTHDALVAVLDDARRADDPVVRAEALGLAHHCLLGPGNSTLRRRLADELVGEAARGGHRGQVLMGLLCQTVDLFLDGEQHAQRRLSEMRAELDRGPHLAAGYVVAAIRVMLRIRSGQLAEAEQLARECHELGLRAGDGDAPAWLAAHLAAIYWYSGRVRDLLPVMNNLVNSPQLSSSDNSFRGGFAIASAAAGDHQAASAAVASLLHGSEGSLPRTGTWLVTLYCAVEAAYLIGDTTAAAAAYEKLLPYRDELIMVSLAVACFGSVEHALGVASLVTGDLDRAVEHLQRAAHRNLALGHWPALLYSRLRLAEALKRRRGPDDLVAEATIRDQAAEQAGLLHATAAPRKAVDRVTLSRVGRRWRLELGGRVAYLKQSVGVLHLAVLIANPGTEISALDLVAGLASVDPRDGGRRRLQQSVLDRTAVQQYRQRLTEIAADSSERAWLEAELAANARLAAHPRLFSDNTERARLAVSRAIRRTITAIGEADDVIGAYLEATVHTGGRCWYRPA